MQSRCNNNIIKSPSDTMIYAPALRQVQENSPLGRVINMNGDKCHKNDDSFIDTQTEKFIVDQCNNDGDAFAKQIIDFIEGI